MPRRGSRVRSPSRALIKQKGYPIGYPFLFYRDTSVSRASYIFRIKSAKPAQPSFLYGENGSSGSICGNDTASEKTVPVVLPEGNWNVCIQDDVAGTDTLSVKSGSVEIAPISAAVLVKA